MGDSDEAGTTLLGERLRKGGTIAVGIAGGLFAAATLLGLFGYLWWPLDLVANFRPQYLVALAVLTPAAALCRRMGMAAGLAAAALVNLGFVGPYLWSPVPEPGPGERIEVVSFNAGISNPARGDVMQYLRSEDPDVVFLFESSFEWEDSARFAGLPYRLVVVVPPGRLSGISVLVRAGLEPVVVPTPFDARVAAAIEIPLDDGALTILGMHPPSPTTGARTARRNELLDQAGDWIRERVGPVLVVGDLNATPWSAGHRALRRGGGLIDSLRGRGLQPTWPDGWGPVMIPIDHALHTVDLAVAERRTGPATGSAHRPLIITVGRSGAAE